MTPTEVLVIGAGPAGMAAATAAAAHGRRVIVLDDNARAGGQIWRAGSINEARVADAGDGRRRRALAELARCGATVLTGHQVFQTDGTRLVEAVREERGHATAVAFGCDQMIVATGARERFLPFPGWTLPGVFGAGGLQALASGGFPVAGRRVVVAGSGPLLLAVAAHLKHAGAEIPCIVEQAGMRQLAGFAASLWTYPARVVQGLRYRGSLPGTAYRTHCWPVAALPSDEVAGQLRAVRLTDGRRTWEEPCDLLACGFHLAPNTEVAALLGCEFAGDFVKVDGEQRTSVQNVFCVGEPTGIGGVDAALLQGEIAGLCCAGVRTEALQRRARRERGFSRRLASAFALRPELRSLAAEDTVVCRCEDVPLRALRSRSSWTDAKLQTRCGMGPCQGRICGPALQTMFGWQAASVRPPLFPVPVAALCSAYSIESHEENT